MTYPDPQSTAPGLDLIEALALDTILTLPEPYRLAAQAVLLRTADFAPEEMLQELGCDDPFDLTGLYDGVPLTDKSHGDTPTRPDTIWLFRRPILEEWIERGDIALADLVAHIYVHELSHHFGWTDEQIAAIDPWWE
jgi:predicted Zn-dependent protease with MMP-like domain